MCKADRESTLLCQRDTAHCLYLFCDKTSGIALDTIVHVDISSHNFRVYRFFKVSGCYLMLLFRGHGKPRCLVRFLTVSPRGGVRPDREAVFLMYLSVALLLRLNCSLMFDTIIILFALSKHISSTHSSVSLSAHMHL